MKKNNKICLFPFSSVEIYDNGDVCCCWCPYLISSKKIKFGNIYEQDFEEIWNGEFARNFRQDVIDGKYSMCNIDMCASDGELSYYTTNKKDISVISSYPISVTFSMDHSCNQMCKMCRDKINYNEEDDVKNLDALIETKLLPVLKNAKIFYPCSRGELFASKHSMKLVKAAAKMYPALRYCIYTNGLFCTKENIEDIGLDGKIDKLLVSVHAISEETYKKVVIGGNFSKVLENIKYYAEQQAKGIIGEVHLNFVVSSLNYTEMAPFAEFAKSLNLLASFWEFRNWQASVMCKNYDEFAVCEEYHPLNKHFVELMQNPIFNSRWVWLNDKLKKYCPKESEKAAKKRILEEEQYIKKMGFDKHIRKEVLEIY